MDILLIEGDARRRVAVGSQLANCRHRVTISSSIDEAQEILRFIVRKSEAPDAVVIAENLLRLRGAEFREELASRFPSTSWIPLPYDRDVDWLVDWLDKVAARRSGAAGRQVLGPDVLVIEAEDGLRQAIAARMSAHGERVAACRSIGEANEVLATIDGRTRGPLAVVARVALADGDGISFHRAVQRRFPKTRWVVIAPPCALPRPAPGTSADMPVEAPLASRPVGNTGTRGSREEPDVPQVN